MREVLATLLCLVFLAPSVNAQQQKQRKRMRVRQTPVRVKLLPQSQIDANNMRMFQGLLKEKERRERYVGLTVKPHPAAAGRQLEFQTRIGEILAKNDFVPPARIEQFKWIPTTAGTKVTGWDAQIVNTMSAPEGTLVELKVSPKHDGNPGLHTASYAIETYLYANGSLHYVGSKPVKGITTFN